MTYLKKMIVFVSGEKECENKLVDKRMDRILLMLQLKIGENLLFVGYVCYKWNIVDGLKRFFCQFLLEYKLIILVFYFQVF